MVSLASYLASLAGGAPEGGQKLTPAGGSGASGLFAAILETTPLQPGDIARFPHPTDPTGLLPTAPNTNTDAAPGAPQVAGGDSILGDALTEGIDNPDENGDVEAEIIDGPLDASATDEILGGPGLPSNAANSATGTPASAPQTAAGTAAGSVAPAPAPDTQDAEHAPQPATPRPDAHGRTPDTLLQQQASRNQTRNETSPPFSGLANTAQHASANGRGNGPTMPHAGAGQGTGTNATTNPQYAPVSGQYTPVSGNDAEAAPDPSTQGPSIQGDGKRPTIAPGQGRPEFAPGPPQIVQRFVKTDAGQNLIQVQERTGGEPTSISSPPTLTVSVQAPAASPGPASPPAPHVPVGGLAVHIAHQAKNGAKRFDIRLDPPELGRIEVRLDVSREGQVMTHLVVERAETLDLLLRDAKQLERALQDAGLDTSDKGMKFSLKDQGLSGEDQGFFDDDELAHDTRGDEIDDGNAADTDMPPPQRYIASTGLDIRI